MTDEIDVQVGPVPLHLKVEPRRAEFFLELHPAYVQTARLRAPLGTVFVGIAFDNPHKTYKGGSEDLFVLFRDTWTDQELQDLEAKRVDLGLWKNGAELWRYRQDEFPQPDQFVALVRDLEQERPVAAPRKTDNKKAAKRLKQIRDASRRKNRRGKK